MKRKERIKVACGLYFGGKSFREVASSLEVSPSTIYHWTKTPEWRQEWAELEKKSSAVREKIYQSHEHLIEETSGALGEFCLEGLQKALAAQKAIRLDIENVELPPKITTLEELGLAIKALRDLNSLVDLTWQNFIVAVDLQEYLKEHQAPPEIDFQEYSDQEIEAIKRENN